MNCYYLHMTFIKKKKNSWGTRTILICQWNHTVEIQCNRNKIFFSHKTISTNASKLKCKYKGCQTNLLYKCLPNFHLRDRDEGFRGHNLRINILPQFFASLTFDSLANWGSSHLKEVPKPDKCNLSKTV